MTSATNKRDKERISEESPNDVVAIIFHVDDKIATIVRNLKHLREETHLHLHTTLRSRSHVSNASIEVFPWILRMLMMAVMMLRRWI